MKLSYVTLLPGPLTTLLPGPLTTLLDHLIYQYPHRVLRSSVPTSLMPSKFMFMGHDSHRTPLQCLCDGPNHPDEVLEPGDKVFRVCLGDREEFATVDRLKPAVMSTFINSPLEQMSTAKGTAARFCRIGTNIVTSYMVLLTYIQS